MQEPQPSQGAQTSEKDQIAPGPVFKGGLESLRSVGAEGHVGGCNVTVTGRNGWMMANLKVKNKKRAMTSVLKLPQMIIFRNMYLAK